MLTELMPIRPRIADGSPPYLDHIRMTRPALNYVQTVEPMAAVLWGTT